MRITSSASFCMLTGLDVLRVSGALPSKPKGFDLVRSRDKASQSELRLHRPVVTEDENAHAPLHETLPGASRHANNLSTSLRAAAQGLPEGTSTMSMRLLPRTQRMSKLCTECDRCATHVEGTEELVGEWDGKHCTEKCLESYSCNYVAYSEHLQKCRLFPVCDRSGSSEAGWSVYKKQRAWFASLIDLNLIVLGVYALCYLIQRILDAQRARKDPERQAKAEARERSVRLIQRTYRGRPARRELKERRCAAQQIQASVRQWVAARQVASLGGERAALQTKIERQRERRGSEPDIRKAAAEASSRSVLFGSQVPDADNPEGSGSGSGSESPSAGSEEQWPQMQASSGAAGGRSAREWAAEHGLPESVADCLEAEEIEGVDDIAHLSDQEVMAVCAHMPLRERGRFLQLVADLKDEDDGTGDRDELDRVPWRA